MEQITITTEFLSTESEVYNVLKSDLNLNEFKIEQQEHQEINVGPVIAIPMGIIVAGIGALSAIVGSLLGYLAKRKTGEIIITGSNGRSIKVPKDTKKDDIDYYIQKAKEIDGDKIKLVG